MNDKKKNPLAFLEKLIDESEPKELYYILPDGGFYRCDTLNDVKEAMSIEKTMMREIKNAI